MTDTTAETRPGDQSHIGDSTPAGECPNAGHGTPAGDRTLTGGGSDSTTAADAADRATAGAAARLKRWVLAVLAAAGVGLPIGWLLCYGGLLPFFLGLFFFLLFGLLLGAVAYRIGVPARPLSKAAVVGGTAVVVGVTWATSLLVEAHDFPDQVADVAFRQPRKLPAGTTPEAYCRQSADEVAVYLREKHPPGGVIGYVHWALTSSRIDPPVGKLRKPFRSSQPRGWWAARVVLSIFLLGYGVYSQIGPLTRLPAARDRTGTAVNPLSKI